MVRSIIRSARADKDLIEIWLWIARDDPATADRVLDAIEARWGQLAAHPFSGGPPNCIRHGRHGFRDGERR